VSRDTLAGVGDRFVSILNTSPPDVEAAMALYTDDLVFEDPTFGLRQQTKPRFREAVRAMWATIGSVAAATAVQDRILSGSLIILRGLYSQKRTPAAPANDRVAMSFVTVLDVRDGRIARHWDFFDKDTFERQRAVR
jgi:ketosteroid isomerase-like protein